VYQRQGLALQSQQSAAPAPAYLRSERLQEEQVTLRSGDLDLGATLVWSGAASGKRPGVLLVSGSGPNDRDETVGGMKPFRDLAVALANAGYAVLRYDKRTFAYRSRLDKLGDLSTLTVYDEYVPDAVAAARFLGARPEVDPARLVLIGHSLGAWMLPEIAQALGAGGAAPKALVLLAAPGADPGGNLLRQLRYKQSLAGSSRGMDELVADAEAKIATLKSGGSWSGWLLGASAFTWADMLRRRPLDLASRLPLPLLVLRGEKDYQVSAEDMQDWTAALSARGDATLETLPELNHLLAEVAGQSTGAEYFRDAYVDPGVVDLLVKWLRAVPGLR